MARLIWASIQPGTRESEVKERMTMGQLVEWMNGHFALIGEVIQQTSDLHLKFYASSFFALTDSFLKL